MGIVMSNDYDKNIPGKGWKTNIKIIKELLEKKTYRSVKSLIIDYCDNYKVSPEIFRNSINVFY